MTCYCSCGVNMQKRRRGGKKRTKKNEREHRPGGAKKLGLFPDRRCSCRCWPVIGRVFQASEVSWPPWSPFCELSIRWLAWPAARTPADSPLQVAQSQGQSLAQSAFLQWRGPAPLSAAAPTTKSIGWRCSLERIRRCCPLTVKRH